ncbi:MAG: hypothetical protein Q4A78_09320 [Peptostreptococcaceae bacterium]|nr:hypothetical protein [Peptostreptococcaceae bacterium]
MNREVDFEKELERWILEKKKSGFRQKPLEEFRNKDRNFEYDYEEDPYEPIYEEER